MAVSLFWHSHSLYYLEPALQGYRLVAGVYAEIPVRSGALTCYTLGIGLRLVGADLQFRDCATRDLSLSEAEAEHVDKEFERSAKEARLATPPVNNKTHVAGWAFASTNPLIQT